jgi:aryl-alcohol dehydrogenase-like predicted oxidoreductase
MRYRLLGRRTGLRVSLLAIGAGRLGVSDGARDPAEARRTLAAFADAGGNLIDTSSGHQGGNAETIIGAFVGEAGRDRFVISSKYTRTASPAAAPAATGNHRGAMIAEVENSLRRMKTDRIDLYAAEFPDAITPIDEIVRGMETLVQAGKVVHVALSNFQAWQVGVAATLADLRGWTPIAALHYQYNLIERSIEREHLAMAQALGLGILAWCPLAAGALTRGVADGAGPVVTELRRVAAELGAKPVSVALAWLMDRGVVPVAGARNVMQLEGVLAAVDLALPPDHVARLDQAGSAPSNFPEPLMKTVRTNIGIDAEFLTASLRFKLAGPTGG